MRLVAGLHPDPLGELEPPPDPPAVIGGGKGRKGLEMGIRRKGKEGKDIKGHGGMGRGGRVRRKDGAEEGEIVGKVEGGLELEGPARGQRLPSYAAGVRKRGTPGKQTASAVSISSRFWNSPPKDSSQS